MWFRAVLVRQCETVSDTPLAAAILGRCSTALRPCKLPALPAHHRGTIPYPFLAPTHVTRRGTHIFSNGYRCQDSKLGRSSLPTRFDTRILNPHTTLSCSTNPLPWAFHTCAVPHSHYSSYLSIPTHRHNVCLFHFLCRPLRHRFFCCLL